MGTEEDYIKQDRKDNAERRLMPSTDLDLQLLVTNPVWGKSVEMSEIVKSQLTKTEIRHLKAGDFVVKQGQVFEVTQDKITDYDRNLWEELQAIYTRDLRLGNLNRITGERAKVEYYIDLAGDFLQEGYKEPFFKAMKIAVTILEVSQSSAGFLRNRQATFTRENILKEESSPKRSLLGGAKNPGQGGNY